MADLTPAERAALQPFTVFSDRVGASLKRKGLLQEHDGVWTHTKLGVAAAKDKANG